MDLVKGSLWDFPVWHAWQIWKSCFIAFEWLHCFVIFCTIWRAGCPSLWCQRSTADKRLSPFDTTFDRTLEKLEMKFSFTLNILSLIEGKNWTRLTLLLTRLTLDDSFGTLRLFCWLRWFSWKQYKPPSRLPQSSTSPVARSFTRQKRGWNSKNTELSRANLDTLKQFFRDLRDV